MEYIDEKIVGMRKELLRRKYTDIKAQGVLINGEFMKFPSVNRPQKIFMVGMVLWYEKERLGDARDFGLTLEQGSQVIGHYNGILAYGQARICIC